jgi:DNA-binding response OmpR family regulator
VRLLLIEDDVEFAEGLAVDLRRSGFAVDLADNGIDGEFLGDEGLHDVVVLDLGLPQRPGLEVLRNWRARGNDVPVIVLTARDAWYERVEGFQAGADDYLGKPFHVEELVARLHALVHRRKGFAGQHLQLGDLRLDQDRREVQSGSAVHALTATEFKLLHYFMLHPGIVLSKTRLVEHVYDEGFDSDSNLIEVYIRRLRDKLGQKRIQTRRGQGYVLVDDDH